MEDDVEGILFGDDAAGRGALGARPVEEAQVQTGSAGSDSDAGSDDFEIVIGGGDEPAGGSAAPRPAAASTTVPGASSAGAPRPGVDMSAVGQIGGVSLFDVDLDDPAAAAAGGFADRPWRKPGADVTDYFNYGFTETTWKQYCAKQRALRDEYSGRASAGSASGARGDRGERERSRERMRDISRERRRAPRDARRDERDDRPSRPGRPEPDRPSRPGRPEPDRPSRSGGRSSSRSSRSRR